MIKKIFGLYSKFSKRERFFFFASVTILIFLTADRTAVGPALGKVSQLNRRIADEELSIRQSLKVLLRKEQIQQENKQFGVFSVEARNPEEEFIGFLKEIETIAQTSSVNVLYIKPGNVETDASGIKKYFSSLECEGQMEQVASFFHSLESSSKLLKIEKYDIQPKGRESSIARCSMTVSKTVLLRS